MNSFGMKKLIGAVIGVLVLGFAAQAPAMNISVGSVASAVSPGSEFTVSVNLDLNTHALLSYSLPIHYDHKVLRLQKVSAGNAGEFTMPISEDNAYFPYMYVWDNNNFSAGCTTRWAITLVNLTFKVLDTAPPNRATTIELGPEVELFDCDGYSLLNYLPTYPWPAGSVQTQTFIAGPAGVSAYLDLDGTGTFTEEDAVIMHKLMERRVASNESGLLAENGRECDINGNGIGDLYDAGRMDALVRPIRLITAGLDGVCQSFALGDDEQEIPFGQGVPNTVVIVPGFNYILQSAPGGDDVIRGQQVLSGPNGVSETPALGDDIQVLAEGKGEPNGVCVSVGENQDLDSFALGDDLMVEDAKSSLSLFTRYSQNGAPAKLVKISPRQNQVFLDSSAPIPLTVAVWDGNDRPKTGISPVFEVTLGTGYLDNGSGGAETISGLPSDRFCENECAPRGQATVMFFPGPGFNLVQVSLPGDSTKGVLPATPVFFEITVLSNPDVHPNHLSIMVAPTSVKTGETVQILLTVKDGMTGVHGLANRIMLLSSRNAPLGSDPTQVGEEERFLPIFHESFESGDLSGGGQGPWNSNGGTGYLAVGQGYAGMFGNYSLEVMDYNGPAPEIYRMINTAGCQDIQISYEWAFFKSAALPDFNVHFQTLYSLDGSTYRLVKDVTGANLMIGDGVWMHQKLDLRGIGAAGQSQIFLKFVFDVTNNVAFPQTIYLDNVSVSAVQIKFSEGFEGYQVGQFPVTLTPTTYIISGRDGILQSIVQGDDAPVFATGQGLPYAAIIYPGPNLVNNSTPCGDDQMSAGQFVNAGANGIAETIAQGDDFQAVEVGKGEPLSIAIYPGANQKLDSIIGGDDQVVGAIGSDPRVEVDSTIYPMTGGGQGHNNSSKFLYLGRAVASSTLTVENYSVSLRQDLSGLDQVKLTFYSKTRSQVDFGDVTRPAQEFAVEVSDNGGKSWVKVWDSQGAEDLTWTKHQVFLYNDGRFNLEDGFLIRWRASMDNIEDEALDSDGVYLDDISITGISSLVDVFSPLNDTMDGQGHYTASMSSFSPGNTVRISAVYWPSTVAGGYQDVPLYAHPEATVQIQLHKIEQSSIQIIPDDFILKACQAMPVMVVGRFFDTPAGQVEDLTKLFRFKVNGPAREVKPGWIAADCFTGNIEHPIQIYAIPKVPGVYDPGGGGGGEETGDISGRIYKPNYSGAGDAPIWVDLGGGQLVYAHTDANGFLFFPDLPAGAGYTMYASLQGYTKKAKTNITVTAGGNTSVSYALLSGTDFDADGNSDGVDTDVDGDGVPNTTEATLSSSNYEPDTDGDGYPDSADALPNDAAEHVDTDGDAIGNNADTDDDNDGILDAEEVIPGVDGYITDPLLWDTDGGGESDGSETANSRNPTNPSGDVPQTDTDGDGLLNAYETDTGIYLDPQHTGSDPALADTDGDGLNDGFEVNTSDTDPNLADTDGDGLNDHLEDDWCADPNVADTDGDGRSDGAEDADHDGVVDTSETDPCDADSDNDAIPDGYEVARGLDPRVNDAAGDLDGDGLTNLAEFGNGTYANNWDSDNDALPDGYELTHAGSTPALDPLSAADGVLDYDSDGNTNRHEYWNGSDPWTADKVGGPGCYYWGDSGAGDGVVGPSDAIELQKVIIGVAANYAGVVPNTGETQELNMDGAIGPSDFIIIQQMILSITIPTLGSRPTSLVLAESPGATVDVGSTCHVKVKVANAVSYTPGFGVVFEVDTASSTGTATVLGGEGLDGVDAKRYDLSHGIAEQGWARVVLKINSAGAIYLKASIPQCGDGVHGRACPAINLSPAVQIQAE